MTPEEYIQNIPEDRKAIFLKLREAIRVGLPDGFEECISYGMIGFVVPHKIYPKGYHCDPKLPLPFISLASQKNSINLYHMGIYANSELHDWFVDTYKSQVSTKLDMGKSCIRFKINQEIPYNLIQDLCSKMNPMDWVDLYESAFKR